ncbi:MAG: hypothetical protein IPI49_29065 [Myxococcales bacterium]|nr:hypothetical protein [Myxococcales bacterium]
MVAGSVGALGDNYLLNIKVVEVATARQLRRSPPSHCAAPPMIIDSVRVAAYRLLAPEQVHGSIAILSDLIGGEVLVDGSGWGLRPAGAVTRLDPGAHVCGSRPGATRRSKSRWRCAFRRPRASRSGWWQIPLRRRRW